MARQKTTDTPFHVACTCCNRARPPFMDPCPYCSNPEYVLIEGLAYDGPKWWEKKVEFKPEKYRPHDKTERDTFLAMWCFKCKLHGKKKPCDILRRATTLFLSHPLYPIEWQREESGRPACTAFETAGKTEEKHRDDLPGQGSLF